jgi:hypothetical protein
LKTLSNDVLDLSACFPTCAPRSSTYSLAGATHTLADALAYMLVAAAMAAMPVPLGVTGRSRSQRASNKRKSDQNCKQSL